MTAHAHAPHDHGAAHGAVHPHVTPAAVFFNVLVALLFLTVVTVGASRVDFGSANMLIAMGIACIKASLVIAIFMHLKWDTAINKIVFLSSFLFLSLLFIFTLADFATRRVDHEMHTTRTPVQFGWVQPPKAATH